MATFQMSILGLVQPDSTGRCWIEPYDVFATNDVWKHSIIRFKDPAAAEAHGFYGQFTVPQNYVGSAAIIPVWTSTATTNNCCWRFTYRTVGGDDTTSLDQSGATGEQQSTVTDAAPSAAHERMTPTISPTAANFAAGETVEYLFERFDNSAADTMAADAVLHDLLFQWADA